MTGDVINGIYASIVAVAAAQGLIILRPQRGAKRFVDSAKMWQYHVRPVGARAKESMS